MIRKLNLVVVVLVIVVAGCIGLVTKTVVTSTSSSVSDSRSAVSPYPGGQAPDFSLRELSGGKVVSLSALLREHKPIMINAFASWCGPCNTEAPDIIEAEKKYGNRIQFVGLNMTSQETGESDVTAFVRKHGLNYPILMDPNATFLDQYAVNGFPTSFFIDSSGKVVGRQDGMLTKSQLDDSLRKLLTAASHSN